MFDITMYVKWIKKNIRIRDYFTYKIIALVYFATRLINLDKFPIFTDEGIYIRWARVAWHDANWRFISLTDGRQPLQTWLTIPFLKFFPDNLLLGGRLFAVLSGFISLIGIFALTYYLFGKRASFIAGALYVLTPFFLFYDRLALVDSMINAGFVWSLFFLILLARTLRLDVALIYGIVSGITLLAKSSAKLFLVTGVVTPILFLQKNYKIFGKKLVNFLLLFGLSIIIALVLYNVQRLSPFFHFVDEKNNTFVMTFDQFRQTPFMRFPVNIWMIPYFIFSESAYILPIFGLAGLILLYKKNWKLASYLALWILIPYMAISFFAIVVYPRYLIFIVTTLLVLAAYFLAKVKKAVFIVGAVLFLLSVSYFDYSILFAMDKIPLPPVDRWQYVEGISAGTGVKEIVDYARGRSSEKPVVILAEGNFGVVGDMLESSLRSTDKITIKGYWPLEEKNLIENQGLVKNNVVLVAFSHRTDFPGIWPITLIKKYDKPGGLSSFTLFELKPKER